MWPKDYQDRLDQWVSLRDQCKVSTLSVALKQINQWWKFSPWRPYYLHWDDNIIWPNPWDLLADNVFCDLARSLGIMYTVLLIDRKDIEEASLLETNKGNLVRINNGKYILNWNDDSLLNIPSDQIVIKKTLDSSTIRKLLG